MKLYSDLPVRRLRQIAGDVFLVIWSWLWIKLALVIYHLTLALAKPGELLDRAATRLSEGMSDAGGEMGRVPVIGDDAGKPFEKAADASGGLAEAGRAQVEAVHDLALWLAVVTAAVPILIVGGSYLLLRWRFVRRATAGRKFVDADHDLDLFALRAMAHQPLHVLAEISDDPAGAWRRRDQQVMRSLASLELRAEGLRPRAGSGLQT
ncbi:MAG: hypothetical protein ACRCYQ_04175 [Nocardioides sp.]